MESRLRLFDDLDYFISPMTFLPRNFHQKNINDVDLDETEDDYTFTMDIGDYPKENINIDYSDKRITVSAKRELNKKNSNRKSEFSYSYTLKDNIDIERSKADYKNGTLTVSLPKERSRNSKIRIK